jgi:hypothetical protein
MTPRGAGALFQNQPKLLQLLRRSGCKAQQRTDDDCEQHRENSRNPEP